MKKIILFGCYLIITIVATAQTPQYEWAKSMGSFKQDVGTSIKTDHKGNVYMTGSHGRIIDLDPGTGVDTVPLQIGFIAKYNSNGNIIREKQFPGETTPLAGGYFMQGTANFGQITIDNADNIYLLGQYNGTVDFDPGSGVNLLTSTHDVDSVYTADICLVKLDSSGNFVWARSLTSSSTSLGGRSGAAITSDNENNVYITGWYGAYNYGDSVDFDPGSGVFNMAPAILSMENIFILKLNASGNFVWAKQFSVPGDGTYNHDDPFGIAVDHLGNVYTSGGFTDSLDFDPGSGVHLLRSPDAVTWSPYLCKLDAAGNFVWATDFSDTSGIGPGSWYGNSLTIDELDNLYMSGTVGGGNDFDPGSGVTALSSGSFVAKYTSSGNLIWAKNIAKIPLAICVDTAHNVYNTGYFGGVDVDFDMGTGTFLLSCNDTSSIISNNNDIYIQKLDAAGNFSWAGAFGGVSGYDFGYAIDVDGQNNIYSTGMFEGPVDFDPGFGVDSGASYTPFYSDIYIHKLSQCVSSLSMVSISHVSDSLVASAAGSYEWYKDGVLISGATTQSYYPTDTASRYTVCCRAHGETCQVCSDPYSFTTGINEHTLTNAINIYPNPNNGQFEISLQLNTQDNYTLELTNALGQVLYHEELKNFVGSYHKQLDETKYGSGIYLFRVKNSKEQSVKKVISF